MFNKIKKFKKDKQGMSTLEFGIGALILIALICFSTDIVVFIWKFPVVTEASTYVARTMALQGGSLPNAPNNYADNAAYYVNPNKMYSNLKTIFATAGLDETQWEVQINGTKLTPTGSYRYDYQEQIKVQVAMQYEWSFSKNIIPLQPSLIGSTKVTVSEYKYSYGSWDSLRE